MAGKFSLADHIQKSQPPQVRDIETITAEILDAKRAGGEAILMIGKGLIEAKGMLSHGEWLPWLEERVEFSEKAAQRFMKLAREYSNPTALSDLGATKALMLLAIPAESREEFISAPHVVNGEEKAVIDMTSRELEAVLKERDDALRTAAQAQADQFAAEQAREKMAQDMAYANQRLAGLNDLVEWYSTEARERQKELARLGQELEELRSQPRDVAVEVDAAAVEAARKETEARMQEELEKAKKAQAEAEKARRAAEDARADAQLEVARANAKLEAARLQAEEARKKTAVASDADLVLFSEMLDQTQTLLKRMAGVRLKKLTQNDLATAQKLHAVIMSLVPVVKEAAGDD